MMHDPCFEGFINHRFADAVSAPRHADQAEVERFKRTTPGRACKVFGLNYITVAACNARMARRVNESDEMLAMRTACCRECQEAK